MKYKDSPAFKSNHFYHITFRRPLAYTTLAALLIVQCNWTFIIYDIEIWKKFVKYLLLSWKNFEAENDRDGEIYRKEWNWIGFFWLSISTPNMISAQILLNCRRNMYIMWKFTCNFHAFRQNCFESIFIGSAAYLDVIIHWCYTCVFVWWGDCMKMVLSDHIVRFVRPKKSQAKWRSSFFYLLHMQSGRNWFLFPSGFVSLLVLLLFLHHSNSVTHPVLFEQRS